MKIGMPLETLRVRDVMTQAVVFLKTTHTLEQAWEAFHQHSVNGAPVLGPGGQLVGMVTTSDLADPHRRHVVARNTVEDVMTKMVYAVRLDDSIVVAARLMVEESIHRAVVLNEDRSIAGIISPMDILRVLVHAAAPETGPGHDPIVHYVDLRGHS